MSLVTACRAARFTHLLPRDDAPFRMATQAGFPAASAIMTPRADLITIGQ